MSINIAVRKFISKKEGKNVASRWIAILFEPLQCRSCSSNFLKASLKSLFLEMNIPYSFLKIKMKKK